MNFTIAFRVDANSQIGTGHFMRCLTLADSLQLCGAQIRFISRGLPGHLQDMLTTRGIGFVSLNSTGEEYSLDDLAHSNWLGVTQARDVEDSVFALADQKWDWMVVDHYALDVRWESAMRNTAERIMVIDDLADRKHDCDLLLDQNYYRDMQTRYDGMVPENCRILLGPRYALLRFEFKVMRQQVRPRTGPVKKILVFFGGVDSENYTEQAIDALFESDIPDIHVDVVIGAKHPYLEQIKASCVRLGYACHVQTARMAELTAQADLAIGAGGLAIWERCCLGLPSLVFCTAENQRQQLTDAAREGFLYSPDIKSGLKQVIKEHLIAMAANCLLRESLSNKGMKLVDGLGTERVISRLGVSDIDIRLANPDDSDSLFKWRNHPSIREVSRDKSVIEWKTHQIWFKAVLADPDRFLLIGQRKQIPLGIVRFDRQHEAVEISIYVVPGQAEIGLGQRLISRAERWLATNHPEVRNIRAQVLENNFRSNRMFIDAGYEIESINYFKKVQ
jgi:UDP-2,4-diacetamido-2,4,6-trideoxy-beta-L-altropyranose hydrolase